ncbi:MAG: mannose-1-phosphate guanylyltransferase [Myxococcota bacterium]
MRYSVIMAGGSGTRFWPLSRRARPKQLLALAGQDETLIAATARRCLSLVTEDHTYVVTSTTLLEATSSALPGIPQAHILAEPAARNTAPCIGWAASVIGRMDPDAVIAVLPADHHIENEASYLQTMETAFSAAEKGHLVTVGITPTRAEIGYGYIEVGPEVDSGVYRARRFVEKPNRSRAEQFLSSGNFLWNSGMFFFRCDVILRCIRQHLPGLGAQLSAYDRAAAEGQEAELVSATYSELPSVSIDHGVMEKVEEVAVVPGNFGWSDLGSWTTAWELAPQDSDENASGCDHVLIDSKGCLVRSPEGKLVAMVGVRDLVVVDTEDALLVVPRDRAQEVRSIVASLKDRGDHRR